MKLIFLLSTALITSTSLMAASLFSKSYEGCAKTKQAALYMLSGNIQSRISTSVQQSVVVNNNDDIQSKVSSYSKASTDLSLVNIEYKTKGKEVCAVVQKADQVENTKKLLSQALLYDVKDLPSEIDAKIEKLSLWINNIKQLSFLLPAFLKDTDKKQEILNKKEKKFTDLYTASIAYSESLFFKSCESTKEKAKIALNKKLFVSKQSKEGKGFLNSITSIFSSSHSSTKMLDIFDTQILYTTKADDTCAMLNKEDLKHIAQNIYADSTRINEKSLSKDPKVRYKEIDNLFEQLKVTKALLKLFPKFYKANNFSQINDKKVFLAKVQKETYPQSIVFNVSGGEKIAIMIDNQAIKNNEKRYLKDGEHTYKITAQGKCPVVDSFSTDLLEDHTVSKDLSSDNYPTVTFITDKEPSIVVNGDVLKANVRETIKECKGKVRYLAKFAGQSRSGEIDTSPGEKNTVELNFLTAKELQVFNDAKTKNFSTTSASMFSESLTAVNSDQLQFNVTREPSHGKLTLDASGSFEYVSDKGYVGVDNFGYTVETPQKTSAPKLVNIKVEPSLVAKAVAIVQPKSVGENKAKKPEAKKEKSTPQEAAKEKSKKVVAETKKKVSVTYDEFKMYVESKELTEDFLKKVQKKFPDYFERLRKEMTQ